MSNTASRICMKKQVYFYWGNLVIPYMRYLSLLTFSKYNPDWSINLYIPQTPHNNKQHTTIKNYFPQLYKISNLKIVTTDFDFLNNDIDFGDKNREQRLYSEAHKSDFLRWYLLSRYCGLWSDIDIIYLNSVDNILTNYMESHVVIEPIWKHKTGILFSNPSDKFFQYVLELAQHNYKPLKYQTVGPDLLNKHFPTIESIEEKIKPYKINNISRYQCYPFLHTEIGQIYSKNNRYSAMQKFKQIYEDHNVVAVHWYGGHKLSKRIERQIDHTNIFDMQIVFSKIAEIALGNSTCGI